MERYAELQGHPLPINMADRNRLVSSGLISSYQAASLLDYRTRHGDVLSAAELSAVDGFGLAFAMALSRFVSFSSVRQPGALAGDGRWGGSVSARLSEKDGAWSEAVKAKSSGRDGRFELALAAKFGADGSRSASFSLMRRYRRGKLLLGDYNARFGQGLALWSGFSMSGFMDPAAFSRRPSGLSSTWSYGSTSNRGVAADISFGHVSVSAMVAMPGLRGWMDEGEKLEATILPAVNVNWYGRRGDIGVTGAWGIGAEGASRGKVSTDGRICIAGVDVFGEVAADFMSSTIAGLAGVVVPVGKSKLGLLGRYYPARYSSDGAGAARAWSKVADEAGVSLGLSLGNFASNVDYAWRPSSGDRQLKGILSGNWRLSGRLSMKPKLTVRLRDYDLRTRAELRSDLLWNRGRWKATFRADGVWAGTFGFLGYLEPGFDDGRGAAYIRATVFFADEWDARIYSYERDVPGCYNVPAYYRRGLSASFYASRKFSLRRARLKVNLRAGWTSYPWKSPGQEESKENSAMARLQVTLDF